MSNLDRLRETLGPHRLRPEGLRRSPISVWRQQTIHRVALLVDSAIPILPLTFDAHVRLIPPSALPYRPLPTAALLLYFWGVLEDPPIECGVIDCHPAFLHSLFQLAVTEGGGHVPAAPPTGQFPAQIGCLCSRSCCLPLSLPERIIPNTPQRTQLCNRTGGRLLVQAPFRRGVLTVLFRMVILRDDKPGRHRNDFMRIATA